jgi:hypothetical protein
MAVSTYLVFGDLHGRVLPAFRLATAWAREHRERLDGLLQVGDLGYFPDWGRVDKATKRHAEKDPLELGVLDVVYRTRAAADVFGSDGVPEAMWCTAGNHEDYEAFDALAHGAGCSRDDFPLDHYQRLRMIRDGHVLTLPSGMRVGALWGIDDRAPNARRHIAPRARITPRSATMLTYAKFDVLLTHESPRDGMMLDAGSDLISEIVHLAEPSFAFFGHYGTDGRLHECDFGRTQVHHLHGLEFRGTGGTAEEGCVGVLRWGDDGGRFEYLEPAWLRTVTRHNWRHR